MTSKFFEGAAGTGKTYSLITDLDEFITSRTLQKYQKVLALTYMHGSRARLDSSLSELKNLKKQFDCMTFDAFAGYIVKRWRDLLYDVQQRTKIPIGDNEYDQVCYDAAELLKSEMVIQWVSTTHPVVLVDEAQDLSPARLAMMQRLASISVLFAAADEYQHLDESHYNNVAVQWLSTNVNTIRLTIPKRTTDKGLLQVAHSLRNGEAIVPLLYDGYRGRKELGNFTLVTVPTWKMLAWQAGFALRSNGRTHVILLLSASDVNSTKAINRLTREEQYLNRKQDTKFGPFPGLIQERRVDTLSEECFSSLYLSDKTLSIGEALDQCNLIEDSSVRNSVCRWIRKRKKLAGQTEISKDKLKAAINNAFQNKRRYQRRTSVVRQAMTIHQAKNREFDNVIVLWTYALAANASDEYKRRLLYNAITRAKRNCTVIVMGNDRLNEPPFS